MRHPNERRRHRCRRLPDRDHVKSAATERFSDLSIGKRARDHAMGANRVDTGADDAVEILSETGNGSRQ
jgi:hypothetical protein